MATALKFRGSIDTFPYKYMRIYNKVLSTKSKEMNNNDQIS